MRTFKNKHCNFCGKEYTPVGPSSKFCSIACRTSFYKQTGKTKHWRDTFNHKNGVAVGVGSGGLTQTWDKNPNFKSGQKSFISHGRRLKESGVPCNRCGKDLRFAGRGDWCSHHKDHNRSNNTPENLELLCKSCHQKHHDSVRFLKNFMKVQRLSKMEYTQVSGSAQQQCFICGEQHGNLQCPHSKLVDDIV